MFTVDLDPVIAHLGPVAISWYGLAVGAGVLVGIWLALREADRKGLPGDRVGDLAMWVVLGGLVGGRLLHVVDRWDLYQDQPQTILAIQNGGLAILGAILGGTLAGVVGAWRMGINIPRMSDAAAPAVVLGQAIGRFGCLVTGDSVGPATDGTWGIVYTHPGALAPQLGVAYQPTFFYEQVWDLLIFGLLWVLRKRLRVDGHLFALYLALYALGKFALTFLRTETIWFAGLQEAQLLAIGAMALAGAWAVWGSAHQAPTLAPARR